MIPLRNSPPATPGFPHRAISRCLLGLGIVAALSSLPADAQYTDWNANPPKILPNERLGAGAAFVAGSGRQFPNQHAFAALKADGSITAWGKPDTGGSGAPTDGGYVAVYSNPNAFAALKADGSITAWGESGSGGSGAPTGNGYTAIFSAPKAFVALKADGSMTAWGMPGLAGSAAPAGGGYTLVCANQDAIAALKTDGSISAWGTPLFGGTGAPTGSGHTAISATVGAFAALKGNGSISAWGDPGFGGAGAPTDSDFMKICSNELAFAALKADGSIKAWGSATSGGSGAPTGSGYIAIYSTARAFAALKGDGSISAWGEPGYGGAGVPTDSDFVGIYSTGSAFTAMKTDGSVHSWPDATLDPADSGYTGIYSTKFAFAALKTDGSITAWGSGEHGGSGEPTDSGYIAIYSSPNAFVALKDDGSISAWGSPSSGGTTAPTGKGFRSIQSVFYHPTYVFEPELVGTVGAITSTSAVVGAEVSTMAGKTAASRGLVYASLASNADPLIDGVSVNQVVEFPLGSDPTFDFMLSGLNANTQYTYKAYVTDIEGVTYYSPLASFSTNLPPVIPSDGGDSSVALSVPENSSTVTTISATDDDAGQSVSYGISGGTDAAKFTIHPTTGLLAFVTAPDYEAPADGGGDNVYQVIVAATDDGNPPKSATQTIAVTVTNVADSAGIAIEQPVDGNLAQGATVAFGSATLGQPLDRVFTVRSNGEVPLVLGDAAFSGSHAGEFSLVGALPSGIAVGGSATFTVRFTPNGSGARSAVLNLPNNDQSPGRSSFVINLGGSGTATAILATYATPASQVLGGWVNDGNFTIGQVGTTNPGNNWPSAEGPDKAVDNNTGTKFLHFRNSNAGVILRPTNSAIVFNRLALFTANDVPERDPAGYVIYGSSEALGGSAGTNIPISSLTKIAEGTVTMLSARNAGPTMIQFANSAAYTSYVVVFPTVRNPVNNTLTQISEIQLQQGANPPGVVPVSDARGGQLVGANFGFGTVGNSNPGTNWLAGESPDHALDGNVNTKFAIFRSLGASLISSPQAGPAVVNSLTFWTANDSPERDPVAYQVYGFPTRITQVSGTLDVGTTGTLLSSHNLTLPAGRNSGPVRVDFANSTAFASYLVVFPAVKNSPATTLTQLSEIQFAYVPFVSLSPASLGQFTADFGTPSTAQTVALGGVNLEGNVSVSAPSGFEISADGSNYSPSLTLTPTDGSITATLSVRMSGVHGQVGRLEGNLQVETPGCPPRSLALSGTVVAAVKPSAESLAGFQTDFGSGSASQTLTLSGGGLSGALTVRAPAGFEISTDGTNFSTGLQLGENAGTIQSVYRGDFAKETTAAGKIWVAGTGVEYPASSAFAATTSKGAVVTWGDASFGGDSSSVSSQLGSEVTAVYSTRLAFAAVKADGSVVAWGNAGNGGNFSAVASRLNSGVMAVSSTIGAFAALKADGSVVTWGNGAYGADTTAVAGQLSSGVKAVYSNTAAFAALKADGSVVTSGSIGSGGDSSAVAKQLGSGVTAVYSTNLAFAALKTDGSMVTWGSATDGGDSSEVSSQLSSGVTAVFPTERAFAALKTDGSVVTWGHADYGGDSSSIASQLGSGVTKVFSTERAFAALKTDGSVVTWGGDNYGNNSSAVASQLGSGVTAVYSTTTSFAALKTNGSIVTWGFAGYGGDSSSVASQLSSGVTAVYSTGFAFAALKAGGSVVTWGLAGYGGDSSSAASHLSSGVTAVYSTRHAFAALKAEGSVVTWGIATSGGSDGPANIGVAEPPSFPATLHIRLAATAPVGAVAGNLTLSSSGFTTRSIALSGTVITPDATPAAPTSLVASPGDGEISLAFTAGADAGSAITNHEFSTDDGTNWTAFNPPLATSPVVITGLTNGTTYSIRLRAVNAVGSGAASGSVSATPVGIPIVFRAASKAAAPTSISVSKLTSRAGGVLGTAVSVSSVAATSEEGATVALAGSAIQYTPASGFSGVDRFLVTFTSSTGSIVGLVEMTTAGSGSGSSLGVNPARLTPLSGGRMGIQFNGIPGVAYQLQRSTDLTSWTTIATITAGSRGEIAFTDDNPPAPSGFYRLFKP